MIEKSTFKLMFRKMRKKEFLGFETHGTECGLPLHEIVRYNGEAVQHAHGCPQERAAEPKGADKLFDVKHNHMNHQYDLGGPTGNALALSLRNGVVARFDPVP